ncbi:MAG: hypothetical protein ACYC6Z_04105 [Thermoleophilia bacterium]
MKFDFTSVKKQEVNFRQIEMILGKAEKSLTSSKKISRQDPESAFTLAYESMLKASMAMMFSRGYRPRVQLGHHKTLVNFSKYVLGDTFAGMTATYDKMRGKRNRVVYDVGAVSEDELSEALSMAEKYLSVVKQRIEEENPQMKLI